MAPCHPHGNMCEAHHAYSEGDTYIVPSQSLGQQHMAIAVNQLMFDQSVVYVDSHIPQLGKCGSWISLHASAAFSVRFCGKPRLLSLECVDVLQL